MAGAVTLALDVGPRLLREPEIPARSIQEAMAGNAAGIDSGPAWGLTPVLTASTTVLSLLAYPAHPCWAPLHDGPTHTNLVALILTICTRAAWREVEQWQEGQGEFTLIRGRGS